MGSTQPHRCSAAAWVLLCTLGACTQATPQAPGTAIGDGDAAVGDLQTADAAAMDATAADTAPPPATDAATPAPPADASNDEAAPDDRQPDCGPGDCDDGNPCTQDRCDGSRCRHDPLPDDSACDDGNACNGDETCQAGSCTPGGPLDCDDDNPCTEDCDPMLGCSPRPLTDGTGCADDNPCNGEETCQAGQCTQGADLDCDDGEACTEDSCQPAVGCVHASLPEGTDCDRDGDVCTGVDRCTLGRCTSAAEPLVCDDGNDCTLDTCDPVSGCDATAVLDSRACNDGDPCTEGTLCTASTCGGGTNACQCGAGQSCDSPPAAYCDGDGNAVAPALPGGCSNETCSYDVAIDECPGHCDGDHLRSPRTCVNGACEGELEETLCEPLGCCTDHCCGLQVSNQTSVGPLPRSTHFVFWLDGTFDTSEDCHEGAGLGRCGPVAVADGPDLCVCRANLLSIGDLNVQGERGLVLLATTEVRVQGRVRISARGRQGGAGAWSAYDTAQVFDFGGRGGSYGSEGGLGADTHGNETLEPLRGGMTGGNSCAAQGGGAGGALQISAGSSISVTGSIDAGGGGGEGGASAANCRGGAGGGSGGAILLEAPALVLNGTLSALGGGGGGGGHLALEGEAGEDATGTTQPATGGRGSDGFGCLDQGFTDGGDGGGGSDADGDGQSGEPGNSVLGCTSGTETVGWGGGGGGSGRIRLNYQTCDCAALQAAPPASIGQPKKQ